MQLIHQHKSLIYISPLFPPDPTKTFFPFLKTLRFKYSNQGKPHNLQTLMVKLAAMEILFYYIFFVDKNTNSYQI